MKARMKWERNSEKANKQRQAAARALPGPWKQLGHGEDGGETGVQCAERFNKVGKEQI